MDAYALGQLFGRLLVIALIVVGSILWARRLRARGSTSWWWPLPVGAVLLLGVLGSYLLQGDRVDARQLEPAAAFEGVQGFELHPASEQIRTQASASIAQNPAAEDIAGFDIRILGDGTSVQAVVLVIALDADKVTEDAEADAARGFADEAGTSPEEVTIGNESAYRMTWQEAGTQLTSVLWRWENLVVTVQSADPSLSEELAGALIAAQRPAG